MILGTFVPLFVVFGCGKAPLESAPRADHPEVAILVTNGLVGYRLGPLGSAFDSAGRPLPAFNSNSIEKGGEERLIPLESPFLWRITWNGHPVSAQQKFSDRVDGSFGWLLLYEFAGGSVRVETFADARSPKALQKITVLASKSGEFEFTYLSKLGVACLNFEQTVQRIEGGSRPWTKRLEPGETIQVLIPQGFSPTEAGYLKFDSSFRSLDHLEDDVPAIEIEGPKEDGAAVSSFIYYLLASVNPSAKRSVSPMGMSSSTYNGHVFWDADAWIFPALALLDPRRAKVIPDYRIQMFEQALENAKLEGHRGAKYPWESAFSGKEVAPGDSKKQIHITGTVVRALEQARDLGLADVTIVDTLRESAALYYLSRATRGASGELELHDVMSPDEFHIGSNDLYTNLVAQWCIERAGLGNARFKLPRDEVSLLTYDNDRLRGYKQAAAVLAIYPLQYPEAERQARVMMDRFADKVTKNGPAMSDSIHALIWARLGEKEKAYATWKRSWQDFTKNPYMLFSEKRSKDVTYFVTGAAGCLQTVLYGFLGFRFDREKDPEAAWAMPLKGGAWLNMKPSLPREWKSVHCRNFTLLGKRYNFTVTGGKVTATQGEP